MPRRQRRKLVKVEIALVLNWRKRGKLEDRVGKSQDSVSQPDSFETRDASKAVAQRLPHRIEEH